jgi:tripartite-type tricarboxylate transporter receptor subunit TctC
LFPFNIEKDLQAIGLYTQTSGIFIAVNESLGVKTIQELVKLAKEKPGVLSYASPGVGTIHHLLMEAFKTALGLDILHIPYTSSYTPDLLNGQISMAVTALPNVKSYVESGKIRLLAVGNKQRSQLKPDVPTISETVIPGFDHSGVVGLLARADTPPAIVEKLSGAIAKFVASPEVRDRYYAAGAEPVPDVTPATMTKTIKADRQKYAEIIKELKSKGGIPAAE